MVKKRSASSARGKHRKKNVKHKPDTQIDFGEIPESTGAELSRARRVGRPITGKLINGVFGEPIGTGRRTYRAPTFS